MSQQNTYTYWSQIKHKIGRRIKITLFFVLLMSTSLLALSQTEQINGRVFDSKTQQAIAEVTIHLEGSTISDKSDKTGYFSLQNEKKTQTLIASAVGYKKKKIKIENQQNKFIIIILEEKDTWLSDAFTIPNENPALEWMKKIRLMRKRNDITLSDNYKAKHTEKIYFLLKKEHNATIDKHVKTSLHDTASTRIDTSLFLPIFVKEKKFHVKSGEHSTDSFSTLNSSTLNTLNRLEKNDFKINFYQNSLTLFDKTIISPLASSGNAHYNYHLSDSIDTEQGKEYKIIFLGKNRNELAFEGHFRFDSTTLALTYIKAKISKTENFNLIRNFSIEQTFKALPNKQYSPQEEECSFVMEENVFSKKPTEKSEITIKRITSTEFLSPTDSLSTQVSQSSFLESNNVHADVNEIIAQRENNPKIKTAKWISNIVNTSCAELGFFDLGSIQKILRLTDKEGLKITLPLRTNEKLWKDISLGGSLGYGSRNKKFNYSAIAQWQLPTKKKPLLSVSYINDYRRISHNYNRYIIREDPWDIGDEEAIGTLLSLYSAKKINLRKEFSLSFSNDWTKNLTSTFFLRANKIFESKTLPFNLNGERLKSFDQQSFTLSTRFSPNTRRYDKHLQRIYLDNQKPIVYATVETGMYQIGGKNNYYGKLLASIKHKHRYDLGNWTYLVEVGQVLGKVPYPLLEAPEGNEPTGISFATFNKMKHMEFGHDRFVRIYNEFVTRGVIFNNIPLIKKLKLRELIALKGTWGTHSESHSAVLDFPNSTDFPFLLQKMKEPYVEGTVGITNLLSCITIQFHWRFTNIYENISPWAVTGGLKFSF